LKNWNYVDRVTCPGSKAKMRRTRNPGMERGTT
jgi:hypothetical protein